MTSAAPLPHKSTRLLWQTVADLCSLVQAASVNELSEKKTGLRLFRLFNLNSLNRLLRKKVTVLLLPGTHEGFACKHIYLKHRWGNHWDTAVCVFVFVFV